MPETQALDAIDSAVERLVSALERIATEHGSEAVDLAMAAYQVDAMGEIGRALVLTTIGGLCVVKTIRACVDAMRIGDGLTSKEMDKAVGNTMLFGAASIGLAVVTLANLPALLSPVKWLAAFGSPEILVATNVLKSAGLM